MTAGDVIHFDNGATVVLLEPKPFGTWQIMFVRGTPDHAKGTLSYMASDLLERGEVVDWDDIGHAMDHLHELLHSTGRLEEDIINRVQS